MAQMLDSITLPPGPLAHYVSCLHPWASAFVTRVLRKDQEAQQGHVQVDVLREQEL